jgi:ornithine--oxo-acid transaminase
MNGKGMHPPTMTPSPATSAVPAPDRHAHRQVAVALVASKSVLLNKWPLCSCLCPAGKALSGGTMPVSAVLADNEVMLTIGRGQHGSTYGGNPVAARVAIASLQVLIDEKCAENAERLGPIFRQHIMDIGSPLIQTVRGRGLLNAIVVDPEAKVEAMDICLKLAQEGLLTKPTHRNIIRLAPPLIISEQQLDEAVGIIKKVFASL